MSDFKLNRNVFKAQSALQASDHSSFYVKLTWQERLKIASYLNSIAFNYSFEHPPKMDKSIFSARSSKLNG
jgi:hypothetical protein